LAWILVLGITTALTTDIIDQSDNKFRNGDPLPVEVWFEDSVAIDQSGSYDGKIIVNADTYNKFYNTDVKQNVEVNAKVTVNIDEGKNTVFFKVNATGGTPLMIVRHLPFW